MIDELIRRIETRHSLPAVDVNIWLKALKELRDKLDKQPHHDDYELGDVFVSGKLEGIDEVVGLLMTSLRNPISGIIAGVDQLAESSDLGSGD